MAADQHRLSEFRQLAKQLPRLNQRMSSAVNCVPEPSIVWTTMLVGTLTFTMFMISSQLMARLTEGKAI